MMDAVEFLEKRNRMCGALGDECTDKDGTLCPLLVAARKAGKGCYGYTKSHPAEAVEIVERWAKEHPRKTRQSEFLKMFPRAGRGEDGLIVFCPEDFDSKFDHVQIIGHEDIPGEITCRLLYIELTALAEMSLLRVPEQEGPGPQFF